MSPPIRAIIADDERFARTKLRVLSESERKIEVAAECENGRQTVSAVRARRPDLLLLDIQMPELDGFQVLGEISLAEMPVVVFTSAYDQYANHAFEAHALDYLLKPFNQQRLHHVIERVRSEVRKLWDREITHRILDLLSRVRPETLSVPELDDRLVIRTIRTGYILEPGRD